MYFQSSQLVNEYRCCILVIVAKRLRSPRSHSAIRWSVVVFVVDPFLGTLGMHYALVTTQCVVKEFIIYRFSSLFIVNVHSTEETRIATLVLDQITPIPK